jgi:outer membrane lipoprotein-sorting protein
MKKTLNLIFYALTTIILSNAIFIHSTEALKNNLTKNLGENCILDLQGLMLSLEQTKQKSARFQEEKFLKSLKEPLRSEGTLHFHAPDYLEKITKKPVKERLVVKGELLTILDQQNTPRTFSLNDYPTLRVFLDGIRFILLGNVYALKEYYELDLNGDCDQWNLILVPTLTPTKSVIDRIIVLGEKSDIKKITWVEFNGDFTVMSIKNES